MVHATLERSADMLDRRVRGELAALVKALPTRLRQIHECGIPDTLVHGDFHPGNVRGDDARLTLLDWGDSGVGHPMLDQPAFLDRVPVADRDRFGHHWRNEWLRAAPGCDPERASDLLRPVSALRQAVLYQLFLDRIEPTERVYHAADPLAWLVRAAEERTGGP
jgi:Ser/Thr protein kinase RdoA (MazF antagonist)